MSLFTLCIRRPIAITLLTIAIIALGVISLMLLPTSPLPQIDFPTIAVQASLPGASPSTMATSVATPLERELSHISGLTEMTSASTLGSTRITLQFDLDRDINRAARDVQAAINAASTLLPTSLTNRPTYRKINPADAPIMILALTSPRFTPGQLYDAASTILAQKLSQTEGVGQVSVGGGSLPAVRIELNLPQLNQLNLTPAVIRTLISNTHLNRPKGNIDNGTHQWQIGVNDQLKTAQEYGNIIIKNRSGADVRLNEIATVKDGVQDALNMGLANGQPAILLILNRQTGANMIETVDRINALLPELQASVPEGMQLNVIMDRTPTLRAALHEVKLTLLLSIALVVMVVFLFLRHGRATLIPNITIPVSLMGTLCVLYLAGFSLNNLSLMALTIAVGFVVDDTIVVLENITRHLDQGLSPGAAALRGIIEIAPTIFYMTISLIAVFIPILFMNGIVGRLFHEFAITISSAMLISMVISLTTTPCLCAYLLRRHPSPTPIRIQTHTHPVRVFLQKFIANINIHQAYERSLDWALQHSRITLSILLAVIACNVYFYQIIPKGFFPQQDTGRLMGGLQADQRISFQAMQQKLTDVIALIRQDPDVDNVIGQINSGQRNSAMLSVVLKPLPQRSSTSEQVMDRLRKQLKQTPGVRLFLQPVQDIRMGGRVSNAQYQYTLQADDISQMSQWAPRIYSALSKLPELVDVNLDQQEKGSQTSLLINRETATQLGINQKTINATLNDLFGQRIVSTLYNPLNQYRVIMEAAPTFTQNATALDQVYFTGSQNTRIPLSAFSQYQSTTTPLAVNHQDAALAVTLSFNLAPNVSLSQATEAIQNSVQALNPPRTLQGHFQGTAQAFQKSLNNQPLLILAAVISVYLILGILYESLIHPLTIISTLPSAGVGALLALQFCQTEFSFIALIGIILLIGIVKKNAIMMIDFAITLERQQNLSPKEAIRSACLRRFRPIMMTTLAALFGAIPLAISTGNGAELRQPLGISIVGGLLFSQLLTLYTTPVVYLYLDQFRLWCKKHLHPSKQSTQVIPSHDIPH